MASESGVLLTIRLYKSLTVVATLTPSLNNVIDDDVFSLSQGQVYVQMCTAAMSKEFQSTSSMLDKFSYLSAVEDVIPKPESPVDPTSLVF